MKILHVIPSIAPKYGGPSKVVVEICKNLKKEGIQTTITTTNAGFGDECFPLGEETEYKNVSTIFFKNQFSDSFKYSGQLAKWLTENISGFDLVHIHAVFNHSTIAAYWACKKSGIPYILRPLGTLDPWSLNQKKVLKQIFLKLIGSAIINNASGVHYTTTEEKKLAELVIGNKKGYVVPLSVDESYFNCIPDSSAPAKYGITENENYILFLSRIHHKKGIELLISAFERLSKNEQFSGYKLVIAGDGNRNYVNKIKGLAEDNKNIIFTGWLGEEEKKSFISKADLLTLLSYQENFGLCLIEAMAMGVPVLVSGKVNLAEDIISASAGIICELNTESVYKSLVSILSDSNRLENYSFSAKKLVENQYTPEAATKKLIDMYTSVVD